MLLDIKIAKILNLYSFAYSLTIVICKYRDCTPTSKQSISNPVRLHCRFLGP